MPVRAHQRELAPMAEPEAIELGPPWRRIKGKNTWIWDSPRGLISIQRDERATWVHINNDLFMQVTPANLQAAARSVVQRFQAHIPNFQI